MALLDAFVDLATAVLGALFDLSAGLKRRRSCPTRSTSVLLEASVENAAGATTRC
jgi:hypothetical protein